MTAQGSLLIASFLLILFIIARPLGFGLARLVSNIPLPGLASVESLLWRDLGISKQKMNWRQYLLAVLALNVLSLLILFSMLMAQNLLPLNPQQLPGLSWDLAFSTAVSFVTNTSWRFHAGETTLSHFSRAVGLTVQNLLSAATGIMVIFTLTRAFTCQSVNTLDNTWVDLIRITLWILLPIALLIALFFIQQGVLQNVLPCQPITTLRGVKQLLPMGSVASQEAIKMLSTSGGGFFNANSSHPFENPTTLANLVQMLAIFLIPITLCFIFGDMVDGRRQGRTLLWAISLIPVVYVAMAMWAEVQGNPHLMAFGIDSNTDMKGEENRFGVLATSLFSVVTTAASCGAVGAMHDSFTALGRVVPMWLMQIGGVVFGGVGSGLYGMLLFVLLVVFITGLMIGRTPGYLDKEIDVREMRITALMILITPAPVLLGTAIAMMSDAGHNVILNPGPHGFSEVLYTVSSTANNNGSAFAGLNVNSPFWNCLLILCMFFSRFGVIIPVVATAGSLVGKKIRPAGPGTLPTRGTLFVGLLISTMLLVGALTFVPALALGPVAECLSLY